jgi:hypothetical protein
MLGAWRLLRLRMEETASKYGQGGGPLARGLGVGLTPRRKK